MVVTTEVTYASAHEILTQSDATKKRRRSAASIRKSRKSVWTTLAVHETSDPGVMVCSIFNFKLCISRNSSSNIVADNRAVHINVTSLILSADSLNDKISFIENLICKINDNQRFIHQFATTRFDNSSRKPGDENVTHRIAFILITWENQLSMDFLGISELEEFVSAAGGSFDKSKKEYIKLLPAVYRTVTMMSSKETIDSKVVLFTYDGWSAKMGTAIP